MLLAACTNDMETISMFNTRTLPDQQITEAQVRRSEKGRLQLEMKAPQIVQYRTGTARTVYPQGGTLLFYNDNEQPRTLLRAGYAVSFDDKNLMKAKDSVVVIDFTSGDTIYLEDLIWSASEDRIYSNHPLRAVNGQRVTYGDGFASDQRLENIRILRQRGTIEFQE